MKEIIKIQGYKCPYCGYENTNEIDMLKHMNCCRKNSEYTQKCINCSCLEQDWLTRKLYDGKSICCYDESTCPYANHDTSEIEAKIKTHKTEMEQYGY